MAVPIPVAPGAAALTAEDVEALTANALYRRCIATDADHTSLERELATRFYRAVQGAVGPAVGGGLRRRHGYRT